MDKARVLDKVRKCLALASNDGASEAERARALTQAGKLLASVNLTMEAVADVVEDRVRERHDFTGELKEWPRAAIGGIAKLFFCRYYREVVPGEKGARFWYVGKSVNVATCQMMVEYVISNIIKEANKRASAAKAAELLLGEVKDGTGYGSDWRYAFCLGAAEVVRLKCTELVNQREREGIQMEEGTGTALMCISLSKQEMEKNLAFLKALGIILVSTGIKGATHAGAYAAGAAHGKSINLSRQVGHSGGPKMIGSK